MKKLGILLLTLLGIVTLTGCIDNDQGIDYHANVNIPSIIEADIEDVPDNLEKFVTVNEEYVIKVTVKTDDVLWDKEGDHSIEIIIDYIDGTSLTFNSVLRLQYSESIGIPRIIGVKNRLISVGTESIDLLEGIAFTDDSKITDSGILGSVEFGVEGVYTVVYYAEDDDGNFVSTSSFVIVGDNLPHYDNLLDTFIEVNASDKTTLREYALLYTAAYEKNRDHNISDIMNFYGYFINHETYEELLKRSLREDEKQCIDEVKILFKKNDRNRYQEFFDITLSAKENEHFDNVYEIFNDYAKTVNPYEITGNYSITDTTNLELYLLGSTELSDEHLESLAFYRVYSNLSIDPIYFDVIATTSYEFDYRLLEVSDTTIYNDIKSYIESDPNAIFHDYSGYVTSSENEDEFLQIYTEFYQYKLIYNIKTFLSQEGYSITTQEVEDLFFTVLEAAKTERSINSYIYYNILDAEEIETILNTRLTTREKNILDVFAIGYNQYFKAPYSDMVHLYESHLTDDEIYRIKSVYKQFATIGRTNINMSMDYYTYLELFNGEPVPGFLDDLYLVNRLFTDKLDEESKRMIQTFDFTRTEIDHILEMSYNSEIGYFYEWNEDMLRTQQKFSLLNRMLMLFEDDLDNEAVRHIDNMVSVVMNHELEDNVIDLLVSSNDYYYFIEKYNISFTAYEEKLIKDYIEWSSGYVYQKTNESTYKMKLALCENSCDEQLSLIFEYLYPSTYLLHYDFLKMSPRSLEVILGKDTPEGLDEALTDIYTALDTYHDIQVYYETRLSYYSYDELTRNEYLFTFNESNLHFLEAFYSFYEKRNDMPFRQDILSNVLDDEARALLTEDEIAMLEHFHALKLSRQNITASDKILSLMYRYNRSDLMVDYIIALGAFKDENIIIRNTASFNLDTTPLSSVDFSSAEQESIRAIYQFLLDVHLYELYIEPLYIPVDVAYDNAQMIDAVKIMLDAGYHPNMPTQLLTELYTVSKDTADFFNRPIEEIETVHYLLDYKFRYFEATQIETMNEIIEEYIPTFREDAYAFSHEVLSKGGAFQWNQVMLKTILKRQLTTEESHIFRLLRERYSSEDYTLVDAILFYEPYGILEGKTFTITEFYDYIDDYRENNYDYIIQHAPFYTDIDLLRSFIPVDENDPDAFIRDYHLDKLVALNDKIIDVELRIQTSYVSIQEINDLIFEAEQLYNVDYDRFNIHYRNYTINGESVFDMADDMELNLLTLLNYRDIEEISEEQIIEQNYSSYIQNNFILVPVADVYFAAKLTAYRMLKDYDGMDGEFKTFYLSRYIYERIEHEEYFIELFVEFDPELEAIKYQADLGFARNYIRAEFNSKTVTYEDQIDIMKLDEVIAITYREGMYPLELAWGYGHEYDLTEEEMNLILRVFDYKYYEDPMYWD